MVELKGKVYVPLGEVKKRACFFSLELDFVIKQEVEGKGNIQVNIHLLEHLEETENVIKRIKLVEKSKKITWLAAIKEQEDEICFWKKNGEQLTQMFGWEIDNELLKNDKEK